MKKCGIFKGLSKEPRLKRSKDLLSSSKEIGFESGWGCDIL